MVDADAPLPRSEVAVTADAAWAMIEAGLLPRTAETVRRLATALKIDIDDIRAASERYVYYAGGPRRGVPTVPAAAMPTPAGLSVTSVPGDAAAFQAHLLAIVDEQPTVRPASVIAQQAIASAQALDVIAWLRARSEQSVTEEIKAMRAGRRGGGIRQRAVPDFGQRAAQFELGHIEMLTDFSVTYVVNGEPKTLGDMTGADHEAVASGFHAMGVTSLMLAAIHREVARRIGPARTRDYFEPEAYAALFATEQRSITT